MSSWTLDELITGFTAKTAMGNDVMTGQGRARTLKILVPCELEFSFQFAETAAILGSMGRGNRQDNASNSEDEKTRRSGSWNTVRSAKIKRARALLEDPEYPSKSTLDAVAGLLARHLEAKSPPDESK
jgi:hypothetical protein